ncbi:peptidoglycan DD-metalloendopeptidase family protein [Candidatus Uhrbacteria bacterium]|nr:peptidoglycan DD-metalloendopeptidase family protein [Candidatus Uhrbacteria bacterium]
MSRNIILALLVVRVAHAEQFLYLPFEESRALTCDFCCRDYPIQGRCHGAIDYRAPHGTPILAAADGEVVRVERRYPDRPNLKDGLGNHIRIRHENSYLTIYAHLTGNSIGVREGEQVEAGQQIALSDNSGFSTGPHLHFEVQDPDGVRVNPYGDPPDYAGGCGPNALWATCPPQPYTDGDRDGYTIAQGDCDDDNPNVHPDALELCNGIDDNCSGAADEPFLEVGLGAECAISIGACRTTGEWVCSDDGESLDCTAPPAGLPRPEICDGQDNDCNGAVDDGEAATSCDNGIFCDGQEQCVGGVCALGEPVICNDGVACTIDLCFEAARACSTVAAHGLCNDSNSCTEDRCTPTGCRNALTLDADRDGFFSASCAGGNDCADDNPYINPDAEEVCDGQDNDCNGLVDDADAHVSCDNGIFCDGQEVCIAGVCAMGAPVVCNDGVACTIDLCFEAARTCSTVAVHERCDDGSVCTTDRCAPTGCRQTLTLDADNDGFFAATCIGGTDCNDADGSIHPGSTERCDELDNDCDGARDEGLGLGTACDGPDSDSCLEGLIICAPDGSVTCSDYTPDSIEVCNGLDDDCDGEDDNGASDCWRSMALQPQSPSSGGRIRHTAVWTGAEMIVWGGFLQDEFFTTNTGWKYDPVADSWNPVTTVDAPAGSASHTAVWTGSEMIVWGGEDWLSDPVNTGGRYDPDLEAWIPTSTFNAPSARYLHVSVWTGSEMIVWGGDGGFGERYLLSGGRYNPTTNTWTATSTTSTDQNAPTSGGEGYTAVWTGSEMILWGGTLCSWRGELCAQGRYRPTTNSWIPMYISGAPSQRDGFTAVWTGAEMIVWGGDGAGPPFSWVYFNTGGRYNPPANTWSPTSITDDTPSGRSDHTAVWSGSAMLVWGGYFDGPGTWDNYVLGSGGRYSPTGNSWLPVSSMGAPAARRGHTAVWTGSEMIIWGGCNVYCNLFIDSGGRYTP